MSEFDLIARMVEGAPHAAVDLPCGVGDDCAVIAGPEGREWLVTTDALVEGVHFRREWMALADVGRKALAVNISDIAAMGGTPRFYLVAVGLPSGEADDTARALYEGLHDAARRQGMVLIGGDTVASPAGVMIAITAIGDIPCGRAIFRSGACPGDAVYVSGVLGGAALGLACLERDCCDERAGPFIRRHCLPFPRVAMGRYAAECGMVTAMIDISDGLLADLGHIAEASGVGFEIDAPCVPRECGCEALALELGQDPWHLALSGGEDYELCFTVGARHAAEFERRQRAVCPDMSVARIGTMVADRCARSVRGSNGRTLSVDATGYDHFARRQ